jgi:hypothetical protein
MKMVAKQTSSVAVSISEGIGLIEGEEAGR